MKYYHMLALALVVFLGVSYYVGYTPIAVGVLFLLVSVTAYFLYAKDKAAARAGSWRVPESSLHMVAVLCGWPGALIAQERLRHKTRKQSFRAVFWLCVLVNLGGIAWLHSPQGSTQLRAGLYHIEHLIISYVSSSMAVSAVLFLTSTRPRGSGAPPLT